MDRGINQFYARASHLMVDKVFHQASNDDDESLKVFLDFKDLRSMGPVKLAETIERWDDDIKHYGPAFLSIKFAGEDEKRLFGDLSVKLTRPGGDYRDPRVEIELKENFSGKSVYDEIPETHVFRLGRSDFDSFQIKDYVTDQVRKYKN